MKHEDNHVELDPEAESGPDNGGRLDNNEHPPEPTPVEPEDAGCVDDAPAVGGGAA